MGVSILPRLAAMVCRTTTVFARVDYSLLLTFVGFFIFTGNMGRLPAVSELLQAVVSGNELIAGVAVSQVGERLKSRCSQP